MRFAFTALTAAVLFASPALAGGDWDYGDDVDDVYVTGSGAYYVGPAEYYAGFYPPRWAAPRYYVPRAYLPYRGYYAGDNGYYGGDCEIKRKWRRGRYYEKIDCDD